MAGNAFDRRASEPGIDVTGSARHGLMNPARREICPVVIECGEPGGRIRDMALSAFGAEACGAVIDRQ
jgi:hypothetical protein